jgi:transposase-like protein
MTYMWKVERKKTTYRIQTDETVISKKLRNSKNAKLISFGLNSMVDIYQFEFENIDSAKSFLKEITNNDIYKEGDGFRAKAQLSFSLR